MEMRIGKCSMGGKIAFVDGFQSEFDKRKWKVDFEDG